MIVRKGSRWELYPYKVRYTNKISDTEKNVTNWALPSKKWWEDIAKLHDNITVHEFTKVEVSDDVQSRFEEIRNMPEDLHSLYTEYVLTGDTQDDVELPTNHPFNIVRLRKENQSLNERIDTSEDAIVNLMDIQLMGGM